LHGSDSGVQEQTSVPVSEIEGEVQHIYHAAGGAAIPRA
jgi:hypothetical protein